MFCFIINFDCSEWWTVQKVAKTFYLYHLVLSYFNKWNSFLRTPVTYQWKFSNARLNHANLVTNEKRSLTESETNLSNSSKIVFIHCNESKPQNMVMIETHIGKIPSKTSCPIGYSLLHFHLFLGVWKKAAKDMYPQFCSVENDDVRAVFTWI